MADPALRCPGGLRARMRASARLGDLTWIWFLLPMNLWGKSAASVPWPTSSSKAAGAGETGKMATSKTTTSPMQLYAFAAAPAA